MKYFYDKKTLSFDIIFILLFESLQQLFSLF